MPPQALEPGVTVVSREQLIAPVTREGDGDLGPGELTHQQHGYLRDVGKGLIPDVRDPGDDPDGVTVAHPQLGVIGAEVGGDGRRLGRFIEGLVGEPGSEGLHRPIGMLLHESDDQARVHPPGQEGADRHVGQHPIGHRP